LWIPNQRLWVQRRLWIALRGRAGDLWDRGCIVVLQLPVAALPNALHDLHDDDNHGYATEKVKQQTEPGLGKVELVSARLSFIVAA
jgi:hypothetical protein